MSESTERTTVFKAPRGGLMTDEVGVISGDLELLTDAEPDGTLTLKVRYDGADEWYTIQGGPFTLHDARDHEVLHEVLVSMLHRPQP
ncbi:hypothetical protein [Streptomyces lonarensis]|uniref:Uncharacterized protein n=1 Tax=Streptomyces lonarensis TaxID=700599 RepID=A0A7X6D204_9ACTN|nr:hypothetical protein [Streptomyces lonarensis]NJQ06672.1 hypothetical protein [Streptomyces lonarensis]